MSKKTGDNTAAGEMIYEIVRLPNPRTLRDQALREGADRVEMPEPESQTVEITTSGDAAKKGGK